MSDLPETWDGDTTLLTVNKRLAAELRARHDDAQRALGLRVWPSPDILPWDAWLTRLYEQLVDSGGTRLDLLDATQEKLLWQAVVEDHVTSPGLLHPAAAARSAQASARLYVDWRLERFPLTSLGGDETQTFLAWKADFEQRLARHGQMSRAQLLPLLDNAFGAGELPVPTHLVHAGFDSLSPAQQALFDTLAAGGCRIAAHETSRQAGECHRVEASDTEDEIRTAAAWADRMTGDAPDRRVAIIAPQLTQLRQDIERIFTATLAPAFYLQHATAQTRFNISLGEPLAGRPLVAHALLLLELPRGEQPLGAVGQLLRSPFVGGHSTEWEQRALFDAALRDDGLPRVDLRRLRFRLAGYDATDQRHCPRLIEHIDRAAAIIDRLPAQDTANAWAGHLQCLLQAFGWPGDAPLDSHEFQQRERLQRTISELATLGKVRPRLRLGEAVSLLRTLAQDTLFQPQSVPAPVQVLGPLEAAGMHFDAIWLLGMHDQVWPPAPTPDPLLPSGLQRELGMPHASAERELAFAATLTERLTHSADVIVASHARFDGDREQRPSPLTAAWPVAEDPALNGVAQDALHGPQFTDVRLQPLPPPHATPASSAQPGGAGLLAAQAGCPFRAVARYRLRAEPLGEAAFTADAALLGTLVHELLQRVWQWLGDSATLDRYAAEQLSTHVRPLAEATLDDIGRRRPDLFTTRFRAIEAGRLTRLVIDWLDVERARTQAFRVSTLERTHRVELGGLQLQTRADRVDELANGTLAIVDYKTGRTVRHDGWFDARVTEPQLPLYCLQNDAPVGAALLARVRNDQQGCRYVGLSADAGFAPGVDGAEQRGGLDWGQVLGHWQRALAALANEIMEGRAEPTPSTQACEYCHLGALCRVRGSDTETGDD